MRKIETLALGFAAAALVATGALLAQDAPAPPVPSAPPGATAPESSPPAAPPNGEPLPGPDAASDEVFVPSEELNADDQVTFPVDI